MNDRSDPVEQHAATRDAPALEAIFKALRDARGERTELVDDVRTRMDGGEYMSSEKLNLAIYRMLKESLA